MLNANFYNTTSNLSSACRTLAVAILGAILGLVWSENMRLEPLQLLPLGIYFCIDIMQYLICLICIHRIDSQYHNLIIPPKIVCIKMLQLQKVSLYFVYCKVAVLSVAISLLISMFPL